LQRNKHLAPALLLRAWHLNLKLECCARLMESLALYRFAEVPDWAWSQANSTFGH